MVALLCFLPSTAVRAQDSSTDARQALHACIQDNAVRVEQAFESLSEAVSFLVGSVCAKPAADAAQAAAQAQAAERRARMEAYCQGLEKPDPFDALAMRRAEACESQELEDLYDDGAVSYLVTSSMIRLGGTGGADAEAISLASSLLLDARLARLATEPE